MHAFNVIDFDEVWSKKFFNAVQRLTSMASAKMFWIAALRPDPLNYFYQHFKNFPVFGFDSNDRADEYITVVNRDPGGSPADAIIHNPSVLVIYPDNAKWAVYADRDLEIAVFATADRGTNSSLIDVYPSESLFSASEALTYLLAPAFSGEVPEHFAQALLRNYGELSQQSEP